jgi:hypothetical protein
MDIVRGIAGSLVIFAGGFALHVAGGAGDLGWVFWMGVVVVAASAVAFPALAALIADRFDRELVAPATLIGVVLTGGVLWAANDRAFAWWTAPAALGLVGAVNALALPAARRLVRILSLGTGGEAGEDPATPGARASPSSPGRHRKARAARRR